MAFLDRILNAFAAMSLGEASAWLFAINVAIFVASIGAGEIAVRVFGSRRIAGRPGAMEAAEILLAGSCVVLNTGVAVVGWVLWRRGWIVVRTGGGWRVGIDVAVLLVAMDFLMYVFHRIAHLPFVYPIVHSTHHRYDRPRPLSLFVLNPAEVLGFGLLWLLLLCAYTSTWTGIVIYLAVNTIFGTVGHLGVEPFPRIVSRIPILRHIGSSTFHAAHHGNRGVNFGFYSDIWDRLFRTMR
jgi:lathosterol oxidase